MEVSPWQKQPVKQQTIGKYELIASLGQGGMANVYLALVAGPAGFNKLLVLKILREDVLAGMEEGVNMFLDEARLSARLVHPNIVHTYEVGEHEGRYFIAMEYLDGQSYRAVQRRARATGGIPIHEELRIIVGDGARACTTRTSSRATMASRSAWCTATSVRRTSSSPTTVRSSCWTSASPRPPTPSTLTQVGVIKGKLDYIAPEQLRGDHLDRRADVFALGAMLWEAVTGKRFAGGRKVADVTKVHAAHLRRRAQRTRRAARDRRGARADHRSRHRAQSGRPLARRGRVCRRPRRLRPRHGTEAVGAKSLAAFVTPLFEDERLKMSKLVEQQVDRLKQRGRRRTGDTSPLAASHQARGRQHVVRACLRGRARVAADSAGQQRRAASLRSTESTRAAAPRKTSVRAVVLAAAVAGALVVAVPLFSAAPEPSRRSQRRGRARLESDRAWSARQRASPRLRLPATTSAPSTPGLAAATLVSLTITVTPSHARVSLDGAPITAPFSGQFRRDVALHHLEVTAQGFRSVEAAGRVRPGSRAEHRAGDHAGARARGPACRSRASDRLRAQLRLRHPR